MNIVSTIEGSSLLEKTPAAIQEIELREKDKKTLRKLQEKAQNIVKKYYDTRCKDISFTIKEEVLLNAKNLRVRKLYKKLTDRYIRSFKITKAVDLNIYKLELLKQYRRLYKTFHISLFKLYMRRVGEESSGLVFFNKDDRYQVENIRKERVLKDKTQFLIKWVNYPEYQNTWEPPEYLEEYDKLLEEFRIRLERVKTAKRTLGHQKGQRKRRKNGDLRIRNGRLR